jgi:hypothetical protein
VSLLVIFRNLPPDGGGAATIIRNLFEFADETVTIVGRKSRFNLDISHTKYKKVEIPLSDKPENIFYKIKYFIQSVYICLKEIRNSNISSILGVYRDESSLILSYIVSVISGKPLFVYLTDLYAENYNSHTKKIFQKIIFNRAKSILCLNEAMKSHYISLGYNQVEIILSTVPEILPLKIKEFDGKVFKIAFSGSIIYDRLDLLQMLVKIIGNNPHYELNLYCPHNEDYLKSNQLFANNVKFEYLNDPTQLLKKLQENHLLYLPLTFKKPDSQRSYLQLKTCLGTKSYEYMQTGVPILVHSPSEYYTYKYFEASNSAILLNSNACNKLTAKLDEIEKNYSNYSFVVKNSNLKLTEHQTLPNFLRLMKLINYNLLSCFTLVILVIFFKSLNLNEIVI